MMSSSTGLDFLFFLFKISSFIAQIPIFVQIMFLWILICFWAMTKAGRCFQYEYIIKTIIIYCLFALSVFYIIVEINDKTGQFLDLFFLFFILDVILLYLDMRFTIQRLFDLEKSKNIAIIKIIPIIGIFLNIFLFFKKGNPAINKYEAFINYQKVLGPYFKDIKTSYISLIEYEIYIRKENFKYTFILEKEKIKVTGLNIKDNDFPGIFFEDTEYIYFRNISKNEMIMWIEDIDSEYASSRKQILE